MIVYNFEQGTQEWFNIRKGKITASHAQAIGNAGKGLDTYITELMAEYFSTEEKENFSNKDTERGNELEPIARDMYELENGVEVKQVGFIEYNEFIGVSPDGLVGDDGLIEIKSLNDVKHFSHIIGELEIDTAHYWQMQMQLLITERKWCDYVLFNPNYEKSLLVYRVYPDDEKQEKLKKGFEVAEKKIKNIKSIVGGHLKNDDTTSVL